MRVLHTMIRVKELEKSVNFYTKVLGMRELKRNDYEAGRFTLVFVGYQDEKEGAAIELTYNWDQKEGYDIGNGFGHVAISVRNAAETCQQIKNMGGKVTREAGPMKHGTSIIAFVEDPDGYKIELIERPF